MNVPEELMKKWKELRSHGDGKKIAEQNPAVNDMDVSRAFTTGACPDDVFEIIADFYKKKEEKVNEYL